MKTSQLAMRGFALSILALCMTSSLSAPPSTRAAESRTWTSGKGNTVKATYVRKEGLLVVLRMSDGGYAKILCSALSSQDQKYLASEHTTINAVLPNGEKYVASGKPSVSVITYNPKRHREIQERYRQQNEAHQKRLDQYEQSKAKPHAQHEKKPPGYGIIGECEEVSLSDAEKKWQEQERIRRTRYRARQREIRREDEQLHERQKRQKKRDLRFKADNLARSIERSEYIPYPDNRRLANEADNLSMEAGMIGEGGASMEFSRAASKLKQNSFNRNDRSFGNEDLNRRDAANAVQSGSMNIDSGGTGIRSW